MNADKRRLQTKLIRVHRRLSAAYVPFSAVPPGTHSAPASVPLPNHPQRKRRREPWPQRCDTAAQPFGADSPAMSGDPDTEESAGWTIVGVVRDAKYNDLRREIHPTMYVPSGDAGTFELRTAGDPESLVPAVRNVIRQAGSDLPIVGIGT